MPRLKSPDPKLPLTIRVRASIAARIGDDLRSVIERLVEERFGSAAPAAVRRVAPAVHVEAPLLVRKPFNPQPKKGK